ncbi:MAG: hypothetical protein ACREOW_10765 [Thermodesulfobacteriota bacterium]
MITILIALPLIASETFCYGYNTLKTSEQRCEVHIESRYAHGFPGLYKDLYPTNVGTFVPSTGTLATGNPFLVR